MYIYVEEMEKGAFAIIRDSVAASKTSMCQKAIRGKHNTNSTANITTNTTTNTNTNTNSNTSTNTNTNTTNKIDDNDNDTANHTNNTNSNDNHLSNTYPICHKVIAHGIGTPHPNPRHLATRCL